MGGWGQRFNPTEGFKTSSIRNLAWFFFLIILTDFSSLQQTYRLQIYSTLELLKKTLDPIIFKSLSHTQMHTHTYHHTQSKPHTFVLLKSQSNNRKRHCVKTQFEALTKVIIKTWWPAPPATFERAAPWDSFVEPSSLGSPVPRILLTKTFLIWRLLCRCLRVLIAPEQQKLVSFFLSGKNAGYMSTATFSSSTASIFLSSHLKGNRTEDASWPEIVENVVVGVVDCFYIRITELACDSTWLTSFLQHVFEYPPQQCTYSAGMAGATWNCCCLGMFCVHHTTMHHVTSCKATHVRCMHVYL